MLNVKVETEIQAEVANKINYASREVREILANIEKYATRSQKNAALGMNISRDVQFLTSEAAKLAVAQTKLDSYLEMANVVKLPKGTIQAAFIGERIWFHAEKSE